MINVHIVNYSRQRQTYCRLLLSLGCYISYSQWQFFHWAILHLSFNDMLCLVWCSDYSKCFSSNQWCANMMLLNTKERKLSTQQNSLYKNYVKIC